MITVSKRFRSLAVFVCVLCLCGCVNDNGYNVVRIKPTEVRKAINDTMYLADQVSNLIFYNNRYYLSDYYRGIISVDTAFTNFLDIFPTSNSVNVRNCYMFNISKGMICLYDGQNKHFLRGTTSDNIKYDTIHKIPFSIFEPSRFFLDKNTVICPIVKNKNTALQINFRNRFLTCYQSVRGVDEPRSPYRSGRIIVGDKNYVYTIGKGVPMVWQYNHKSQIAGQFNLTCIEEIKHVVDTETAGTANRFFVINNDAYLKDERLYILFSFKKGKTYNTNHIAVLDGGAKGLRLSCIYELQGSIYSTFCIDDKNQIVTINSKTSAIEIYDI